jgi:hypothetical protein
MAGKYLYLIATDFKSFRLLYLIIRYGDSVLSEFFDNYLEQTLKTYLSYKSAMDSQFRTWLKLGQDFSSLTQKAMADFTPSASWMDVSPKKAPKKEADEG